MTTLQTALTVASTATASATLIAGTHTPCDATSGALTMTLPAPSRVGARLRVEKIDNSANTVTVAGTLRGTSGSIVLSSQFHVVEFVGEPGSSWRPVTDHRTKTALDASYGKKVGTDQGGDILGPVRAPVLTFKSIWPNRRSSYRPVWGNGDTVYAVGRDKYLRKSVDGGLNWSAKSSSVDQQAFRDAFLVLDDGTILLVKNTTPALTIWRSTNDGGTFTQVFTLGTGMQPLGSGSWCQDPVTGYVYFGEYLGAGGPDTNVYRSTDHGATWTTFHTFPGSNNAATNKVKHIHSVSYDPVSQRVYVCVGDTDPKAGIYRVNAAGTDLEPVILNDQMPNLGGDWQYQATAIGLMWFDNYIAWGSDRPGDGRLWRMARSQIGQANPQVEQIYTLASSGWWVIQARTDRSMWLLSVAREAGINQLDRSMHLYAVSNNGATIVEVGTIGSNKDVAHVQPLGPGGDDFWLGSRALGSNFAARCDLSRSSYANVLPRAAETPPLTDYWMTVNSGSVTVPAGGSVVFAHARIPWTLATIYFKEYGVYRTSGTGTLAIKARLSNTLATVAGLDSTSNGPDANARRESSDFSITQDLSASSGNAVEFLLYETGGTAAATGCGTAVYGWGGIISDDAGWA